MLPVAGREEENTPAQVTPDKLQKTAAGAAEGPRVLLPAGCPLHPLPVWQALSLQVTPGLHGRVQICQGTPHPPPREGLAVM